MPQHWLIGSTATEKPFLAPKVYGMALVSACRHFQFSAVVLSLPRVGVVDSRRKETSTWVHLMWSDGDCFLALLCRQMTQPVEASWQCQELDQAVQCRASLTNPKTMDILNTCEHCHMCNFVEPRPSSTKTFPNYGLVKLLP